MLNLTKNYQEKLVFHANMSLMINYFFLYETNDLKKIGTYEGSTVPSISCTYTFLIQTSYKLEKIINHITSRQILFFISITVL